MKKRDNKEFLNSVGYSECRDVNEVLDVLTIHYKKSVHMKDVIAFAPKKTE